MFLNSHSVRGMEMMTPFPVPIHRRLHDTMRAVILTNEKPSFPVPGKTVKKNTFNTKSDLMNKAQCFMEDGCLI